MTLWQIQIHALFISLVSKLPRNLRAKYMLMVDEEVL